MLILTLCLLALAGALFTAARIRHYRRKRQARLEALARLEILTREAPPTPPRGVRDSLEGDRRR